ncbi:MAG TPA: hypothetical protein VFK94_04505 [Patescibacteria group bacterium]|nr:hypothetical protein [Patescibacteria group bacterium]
MALAPFPDPGSGFSFGQRTARPTASASPKPTPKPPEIVFAKPPGAKQTARYLNVSFTADVKLTKASGVLTPDPGFPCEVKLDPAGTTGSFNCNGLLPGSVDHIFKMSLESGEATHEISYPFRTMGNRLEGVRWFTEFEVEGKDPLACAAASIRIIQNFTGSDQMTAEQILASGIPLNRSKDPGLDPVAIAAVLKRLNPANNYHYYNFASKEEATEAGVYWLLRSGKPVVMITLAGQHAPVLIGYGGKYGTHFGDLNNALSGVVMQDPQRGDMNEWTRRFRPDKYRSPEFQTGKLLEWDEWYGDEWWFRFSYTSSLGGVNIDRNDGAYPQPHWAGKFVIIVDDGDAANPSDRMGRVVFR